MADDVRGAGAADPSRPYRRWLHGCIALFAVAVGLSAIGPWYPSDWWLENALAWALVLALFLTRHRFPFSRVSYTLIFVFLGFHELGAHYTYAEVPYKEWFPFLDVTERNHYDRLVHFLFGFLCAYPIREVFVRLVRVRGFWSYYLPLDLTMSFSMLYELIEWAAALVVGGDLGMAYLGTQGDVWDAHKDMALASLGAIFAMALTLAINLGLQRDFASEWAHSLRVKRDEPLGEEEIARRLGAKAARD